MMNFRKNLEYINSGANLDFLFFENQVFLLLNTLSKEIKTN